MIRKLFSLVVLVCGVTVSLAAAADTNVVRVRAALNGRQEVPPQSFKVTNASGSFAGRLTKTKKGYRLAWGLTYQGLSGKPFDSTIHRGRRGHHGPALISLCAPCGLRSAHGTAYVSPGELSLMRAGRTYVNVRTVRNRAGEIRGQIRVS
jgi:hypothetical protein